MSPTDKCDALIQASAQPELDAYEANYMAGPTGTLFRSKARSSWVGPAFTAVIALFVLLWGATHGQLILALIVAPAMALVGLFFTVIRVRVSAISVDVQYGLLGPSIPIESIESAEAFIHSYRNPLRWGISPTGKGERLYTIPGDGGRAVKIVWRDGERRKVHIIGTHEPERLAEAIRTARAMAERKALESA
jgi:hypothetical protein